MLVRVRRKQSSPPNAGESARVSPPRDAECAARQLPDNFKTISKIYIFTKTDKTRVALNKTSSLHRRRVCSGSDDG